MSQFVLLESEIIASLKLVEQKSGLLKYQKLMDTFSATDVSCDVSFQKMFNGFYRIRQRSPAFYACYYNLFERAKSNPVTFCSVLAEIAAETGRLEASFASKLVATLYPEQPIWDKFVLQNLGLRAPYTYEANRAQKLNDLYGSICNWYHDYLLSENGQFAIHCFSRHFPHANISDLKKIDFILWQRRES